MAKKVVTKKHPSASKVLKLMDMDFSYSKAVDLVSKQDKITKTKLEKYLEPYI
jgi:hypothetical protein